MLIDANVSIGHWPFRKLQYNSCDMLLERMSRFGVDRAVVGNFNGIFYKDAEAANAELFKELQSKKKYWDKFIPFGVVNPIFNGWQDDLKRSVQKYGVKGVRMYPKYHRYDLLHPASVELVKRCRDLDLPIALTLRIVDRRPSSWLDIDKEWALADTIPIIKEVPDAKFLILNIANGAYLNEADTEVIKKANVLMDTSGRALSNLGRLLDQYGKDKFTFGTHAPILDYCTGLLRVEALRENEANDREKNLLRFENISKFLNLT